MVPVRLNRPGSLDPRLPRDEGFAGAAGFAWVPGLACAGGLA